MIAFGHTAIGSLIGLGGYELFKNQSPIIGMVTTGSLGVVSHYIADFIPHGHLFKHNEYGKRIIWAILFDFLLSFGLFIYVAYQNFGFDLKFWYIFFGIGGSNLPDVLDGLIYIKFLPKIGLIKLENDFHQSTHWHAIWKRGKLIDGLPLGKRDIWQLTMVCLALLILIFH